MKIESLEQLGKPYKIYAEVLEQGAIDQFVDFMRQDWVVKGAVMPDAHVGFSLNIGGVIACKGVVSPQAVGVDIGCGVCALPTTYSEEEVRANAKKIFDSIYRSVPVGFNHNQKDTAWDYSGIDRTSVVDKIMAKNGLKQCGTLGSGNHFCEIGVDETGKVWIVIHSGSRGIGHATATHYMKLASGGDKALEGHFGFDVNETNGIEYIADMNFCLAFALENRKEMMRRIERELSYYCTGEGIWSELINRNHNHAELKDGLMIHRKGATQSDEGMMGIIPGDMLHGSFVVRGKGNLESLCSSSHGAGRVMGRKEAQRTLNMPEFVETMKNVTARISEGTLDESPRAYKDIFEVMRLQKDLVDVVAHVKPIINIKG